MLRSLRATPRLNARFAGKPLAMDEPIRPAPGRIRLRLLEALADQAEDEELEHAAALLRRAALALAAQRRGKLFRLTYVSHNEWGREDEPAVAAAILGIARRRNAAEGLTGAMAHSPTWFAQVLEGSLADIERTFGRIERDMRHSDIRVIRMEEVREREFAAWAMAEAGSAPDALLRHAATIHARLQGTAAPALQQAAQDIVDVLHHRVAAP